MGYSIFMSIFGLLIFLYGFYIFNSKHPFVPRLQKKQTRKYYKYLGKVVMIISVSPIISALIAAIDESDIVFFASQFALIISFIIGLIISTKYIKE